MSGFLYAESVPINEKIQLRIPRVGEILACEEEYFGCVYNIIATPYEMMVPLDDIGIDFTLISDWDLFCMLFQGIREQDTSLIFGDLSLQNFHLAQRDDGAQALIDEETGVYIDRRVYSRICSILRKILDIPRDDKKPGNDEARRYMLEKERKKIQNRKRRRKNNYKPSQLESMIVSLVNTAEFKYNYETVKELTIYQLYASMKQVSHKISFDKTMIGCYAGTIKMSDLRNDEKTWFSPDAATA